MCWSFISSGWPSALDLLCNCPEEQLQLLSCSCSNRPRSSWNCCFKRHWNCSEIPTWNDLQLHWKRGAIARLQLLKSFKVFLKLLLKMQTNCTGIALIIPTWNDPKLHWKRGPIARLQLFRASKVFWNCYVKSWQTALELLWNSRLKWS